MRHSRLRRTGVQVTLIVLAGMIAGPAAAQYAGPFDDELELDAAAQEIRNNRSFRRILAAIATHNAAIPFGFVPEPITSYVAESTQYVLDTSLKFAKAYLVVPDDRAVMPNANNGCDFALNLPQTSTTFTNNLGFTPRLGSDFLLFPESLNVPSDETISFGELGMPEIYHANTDVILTLESVSAGIFPNDGSPITTPFYVQPGHHTVTWRASTRYYPLFDAVVPAAMTAIMMGVEWKFSKYLDDLLRARAKRAKIIMGSARENLPALTKTLKKMNRRVNILKFINKRLDSNAMDYLDLGKQIANIDDFTDRFKQGLTTVERARLQELTVYDIFQPTISTSQPSVPLEATDIGGVTYARYAAELMNSITASDSCGRPVVISNDAPEFLPMGQTVVTWTVRDPGPAVPGTDRDGDGIDDPYNTAQVTQIVVVEDTQAPIIVPPPGLVVESASPLDIDDYALGQPLVVDLADLHPDVSKSSVDADGMVEVDTRMVVTWAAADNAPTPNVATADQLVTVKTPGTNTAPVADAKFADTRTSVPVDIVLTAADADVLPYSHDPSGPGIADPLQFKIETRPQNGEFESPLLPFFINDYRTDQVGGIYDYIAQQPENEQQALTDDYILAVNTNSVQSFLDREFCSKDIDAPVDFVWEPLYVHVRDNGEQYFFDRHLECDPNGTGDPEWATYPRISRWGADNAFLGHVRIDDSGGGGIVGEEAVFRIDDEDFVYFVAPRTGGEEVVSIQRCPAALADTSMRPGNCQAQGFGPVNSGDVSDPQGPSHDPQNALVDIERELVYVVAGPTLAVFDYRHVIEGDPTSPRKGSALVDWLTNDAGSRDVLDDGVCAAPGNPPFLNTMEVDSQGNLYVTDIECHRIHKFSPSGFDDEGNFVKGDYVGWMGKCSSSNNLACDVDNQRSKGFSCTVAAACTVDGGIEDGSEPGQFHTPAYLAIDPNDILYVADYDNRRVQRFGVDGLFAGQAASAGNGINATTEGGFVLGNMGPPKHVSVNSKNFYVVDQSENFVHIFDTSPFKNITDSSATVTYVSEFAFHSATDTFTYSVNDGLVDSAAAQVAIDVARNYRQPLPEVQSVSVNEDSSVVIVLNGTDPDGIVSRDFNGLDTLTFVVEDEPGAGKLTAGGDPGDIMIDPGMSVWTYTPGADYFGADSFSFTVRDAFTDATEDNGTAIPEPYGEAETAEVTIDVASVNDMPVVKLVTPERVAAGFPVMLDGIVFDDFGRDHAARLDWGDGSVDYRGDIVIDDNGTPNDASDDSISIEGVVLSDDGLLSIGESPVNAVHTYNSSGARTVSLCIKDGGNLETCRAMNLNAEHLAVVGVQLTLDADKIKDGIFFGGEIEVVNVEPSGGVNGLDADHVVLEFEIPAEITLQQFSTSVGTCMVDAGVLTCNFGTLANGASATVDLQMYGTGTLVRDATVDFFAEVRTDTDSLNEVTVSGATLAVQAIALDRDDNGLPNIFEAVYGVTSPDGDEDGDGLSNQEEFAAGTSPVNADTDGDGIGDGDEIALFASDPLEADTDNDGVPDADEVSIHNTDPTNEDTDGDGLPDSWELDNGFDPLLADSSGDADGDGLSDKDEYANESDYLDADSDDDTLRDGDEVHLYETDPLRADTDGDGLDDAGEIAAATNPNKPDTDDDGLYDGTEVFITATNPLVTDTDRDGLPDGFENRFGRNPLLADYALAAGGLSTCALTDSGVECWGRNDVQQAPPVVAGLNDPEQLSVGYVHACAIDRDANGDRSVACWGSNGFGQTSVPALVDPVQVAAGGYFNCSLDRTSDTSTEVVCWGRDDSAQVSTAPTNLEQPLRLVAGVSGSSSCVLDNKSTGPALVCWGQYNNGNTAIPGVSGDVRALALGSGHGCVVDGDERLCWGLNDDLQAPAGPLPSTAVELSLGGFHSCALEARDHNSYSVDCRGRNADGQADVPDDLISPLSLASGSHHSCAFDSGNARCWGVESNFDQGQAPDSRTLDIDPDADGLLTADEIIAATDPLDADTDRDLVSDNDELLAGTNPVDADSDDDGLTDGEELLTHASNPLSGDTDGDGMTDDWEVEYGLQPTVADADGDADGDGLDNGAEFEAETDPTLADTDDDDLDDIAELALALDPTEPDTDGDGMYDGWEMANGFDPKDSSDAELDADGDGLSNVDEFIADADPHLADTDGDGMPDGWEIDNDLDPLVADGAGDPDRDGLSNLGEYLSGAVAFADDVPPALTLPADVLEDSIGPFTSVKIGAATAIDARDGVVITAVDTTGPFSPGPHDVTWSAADSSGNRAQAVQFVGVVPLVDFAVGQQVDEGDSITASLMLNGPAVDYPVQLNYSVSGVATNPEDHNAAMGSVMIGSGVDGGIPIDIVLDPIFEGEESFTLTLTDAVNAVPGSQTSHTITILQANVKPVATIVATQMGEIVTTAVATGGPITVTAGVTDPNFGDTHVMDWSASDSGAFDPANAGAASFTIDPMTLNPGFYRFVLDITDDGSPLATNRVESLLQIVAEAPALSSSDDTDGDGIDDLTEGFDDSDGDRIPDYLDNASAASNVIAYSDYNFVLQTQAGLTLRLGETAFRAGGFAGISEAEVREDADVGFPNLVADFEVLGVEPGATASIVIPLRYPIPAGASYRKFIGAGWQDFVVDGSNSLASSAGSDGACAAPGAGAYIPGLNVGDGCIQLTIEDGGPNDNDGMANGIIRDPGGLAVPVGVQFQSLAVSDASSTRGNTNVVLLAFSLSSDSGDVELDGLTLQASGTGDDKSIRAIHLVVDENRNGVAESGEAIIADGSFDADDGILDLQMSTPLPVPPGRTDLLITYDF